MFSFIDVLNYPARFSSMLLARNPKEIGETIFSQVLILKMGVAQLYPHIYTAWKLSSVCRPSLRQGLELLITLEINTCYGQMVRHSWITILQQIQNWWFNSFKADHHRIKQQVMFMFILGSEVLQCDTYPLSCIVLPRPNPVSSYGIADPKRWILYLVEFPSGRFLFISCPF